MSSEALSQEVLAAVSLLGTRAVLRVTASCQPVDGVEFGFLLIYRPTTECRMSPSRAPRIEASRQRRGLRGVQHGSSRRSSRSAHAPVCPDDLASVLVEGATRSFAS